jgi:branched-chain amino acid transport system ATP-binding protein
MLQLESLNCGYGEMTVVQGLSLEVPAGEITALLGANGAGKSSTILCIAGHVAVMGGRIIYKEKDITNATPMERVADGIAVVPEGRRLFPNLTVKENLIVGGYSQPRDFTRAAGRIAVRGRATNAVHRSRHDVATATAACR